MPEKIPHGRAPLLTDAEKLFNETHARLLRAYSIILGFRNTFTNVSETVANQIQGQIESLFRSLTEDPQWEGLLISEPGSETKSLDPQLARSAAHALLTQNYGSLDAATIVFFHSVLDGIAFDYCRVTMLHAPQDWEADLKQAQFPLLDAKHKSYDEILGVKLKRHLERLEKESLITKVDRLFARCTPQPTWSPMDGYTFDGNRLKAFDEQRHAIIHGDALGRPLNLYPVSDGSLRYIFQTAWYLMGLVNFKYRLKFDADYIGKSWQKG